MAYKGKFSARFPQKIKGDPTNIIFRSLLEYRFMEWCDTNTCVVWWSSEPFPIRYISPIDGKGHSYWPDFMVRLRDKEGKEKVLLIEVKPDTQTRPPKAPAQRKSKKFISEVQRWGVNEAKWRAAKTLCAKKGWEFVIMTEKTLGC